MKKATLATPASAPSFSVTVYDKDGSTLNIGGRAEARFNISDENKDADTVSFKDKSRARVKLTGKTRITEDLYGFGKYETEFDEKSELTNRYYFAGLGTTFEEFSYGKQDTAQILLTDVTDIMATFGGEAADIVDGNKDKRENTFLYSGELDALTVQANYTAADEDNTKDTESYGIAALYNIGSIDIGAGYVAQSNGINNDDQTNLAVQYSMDAITLGILYAVGIEAGDNFTGYEISAKYKPMKKLSLAGIYNYQEEDPGAGAKLDTANEFAIEAVYKFNGNLRTYAGYKLQRLDNTDNELQAGIRYDF